MCKDVVMTSFNILLQNLFLQADGIMSG